MDFNLFGGFWRSNILRVWTWFGNSLSRLVNNNDHDLPPKNARLCCRSTWNVSEQGLGEIILRGSKVVCTCYLQEDLHWLLGFAGSRLPSVPTKLTEANFPWKRGRSQSLLLPDWGGTGGGESKFVIFADYCVSRLQNGRITDNFVALAVIRTAFMAAIWGGAHCLWRKFRAFQGQTFEKMTGNKNAGENTHNSGLPARIIVSQKYWKAYKGPGNILDARLKPAKILKLLGRFLEPKKIDRIDTKILRFFRIWSCKTQKNLPPGINRKTKFASQNVAKCQRFIFGC